MKDQKTLLREAYAAGTPVEEIAAKHGCAVSTIYRATRRHRRRRMLRPSPELLAKVHILARLGFLGNQQIARALGLGRHRVLAEMRIARAAPVPTRDELESENARLLEELEALRAALESAGVA